MFHVTCDVIVIAQYRFWKSKMTAMKTVQIPIYSHTENIGQPVVVWFCVKMKNNVTAAINIHISGSFHVKSPNAPRTLVLDFLHLVTKCFLFSKKYKSQV